MLSGKSDYIFGYRVLEFIETGDMDRVFLIDYNNSQAVLKLFSGNDDWASDRFNTENKLYRILCQAGLSPEIYMADDSNLWIIISYIPHIQFRSSKDVFDAIPIIMRDLSRLHSLDISCFDFIPLSKLPISGKIRLERLLGIYEKISEHIPHISSDLRSIVEGITPIINSAGNVSFSDYVILHNDLQTPNTLVTMNGHTKFIDFGRAKLGDIADDLGYFTHKSTNNYHFPFSTEETEEIFRRCVCEYQRYGNKDPYLAERIWMYHLYYAFKDVYWLMYELGNNFRPERKERGNKAGEKIIQRLFEYKNRSFRPPSDKYVIGV